jgi:carbon storage regulator
LVFLREVNGMLVLTRKKNERIFIDVDDGKRIILTVGSIGGDRVRIGIDAPPEVLIRREELVDPVASASTTTSTTTTATTTKAVEALVRARIAERIETEAIHPATGHSTAIPLGLSVGPLPTTAFRVEAGGWACSCWLDSTDEYAAYFGVRFIGRLR